MATVPAFPPEGIELLAQLERNNTTAWFHGHKDDYQRDVQEPARRLVEFVNAELKKFAPEYLNSRKNPLSRPNRDTRFSKDKSPYRSDVAVVFPRSGLEKHEAAGFFFRISPDGAELIAGTFMPGSDQLCQLRTWVASNHASLRKLARARPLRTFFGELQGTQLRRVPRGYDPDHPGADLLRLTQMYFRRRLPKSDVTSPTFAREIVRGFRLATPFVEVVDAALGNTSRKR
jgi:uncharacterized protein (TIGR02453 family)